MPVLGIVAAACGTLAAIASIPDDPQPERALFWPALWCSLGIFAVPLARLRRDTAVLLRAEHFLMIGLVYWLLMDPLQSVYPMVGASYDDVLVAFAAIGVMTIGIWIGIAGAGWPLPQLVIRSVKRRFDSRTLFGAALIAFLLGMFHFAFSSGFDPITMIDGLLACRFCAPWSRGAMGGSEAFIEHLSYFGYVLPSLTVLIAHQDGWRSPRALSAIATSVVMIAFLSQEGGRRIIGVVVGSALIAWLLLQSRIRLKVAVAALIVVACLLVLMEVMLQYRSVGLSAYGEKLEPEPEGVLLRVDDNILRLFQITKLFPDVHPYVNLGPVIYALVRPVPRLFWEGKPVDPGYDLAALVGEEGVSLTHSVVGEFYAMHGLSVVLMGGIFFGRLANMWNKLLTLDGGVGKSLTYGLGIMALFAALRSMQDLVIMSYGLLAWFVLASVLPQTTPIRVISPR